MKPKFRSPCYADTLSDARIQVADEVEQTSVRFFLICSRIYLVMGPNNSVPIFFIMAYTDSA